MTNREKFGVPKDATVADVKQHWQQIALSCHPDQGGNVADFMRQQDLYNKAIKEALTPVKCPVCRGTKKTSLSKGFFSVDIICPYCK